jgi:DNA-binding IscR family transcriptional regulator
VIALGIALEVARAFRDGQPAWNADRLADVLRVPVRTVRDILGHLERGGIVAEIGGDNRDEGFQLGRPAQAIRVTDVLRCLRGEREHLLGDADIAAPIDALIAAMNEGEAKGAGGQTLESLLSGVQA